MSFRSPEQYKVCPHCNHIVPLDMSYALDWRDAAHALASDLKTYLPIVQRHCGNVPTTSLRLFEDIKRKEQSGRKDA